jgi:hypothetical protein
MPQPDGKSTCHGHLTVAVSAVAWDVMAPASASRCLTQANNLSSQGNLGLHAYLKQSPDLPNKEIASPASSRR